MNTLSTYYGLTAETLRQNDFIVAFGTFTSPAVPTHRLTTEYEAINKDTGRSGILGEDWVFKQELKKLKGTIYRNAINPNYADDPNSCFDILSFDADGCFVMIEVKATIKDRKCPFHISAAEFQLAQTCLENGWQYEIHRVCRVNNPKKCSRQIITAKELFTNYEIQPRQYQVSRKRG